MHAGLFFFFFALEAVAGGATVAVNENTVYFLHSQALWHATHSIQTNASSKHRLDYGWNFQIDQSSIQNVPLPTIHPPLQLAAQDENIFVLTSHSIFYVDKERRVHLWAGRDNHLFSNALPLFSKVSTSKFAVLAAMYSASAFQLSDARRTVMISVLSKTQETFPQSKLWIVSRSWTLHLATFASPLLVVDHSSCSAPHQEHHILFTAVVFESPPSVQIFHSHIYNVYSMNLTLDSQRSIALTNRSCSRVQLAVSGQRVWAWVSCSSYIYRYSLAWKAGRLEASSQILAIEAASEEPVGFQFLHSKANVLLLFNESTDVTSQVSGWIADPLDENNAWLQWNGADTDRCEAWNRDPCPLPGYYYYESDAEEPRCALSPAGGFSKQSSFYPCPPGTFNDVPGASEPSDCKRCPAGKIVFPNTTANSVCFPCTSNSSRFQSADGTTCTKSCYDVPKGIVKSHLQCHVCEEGSVSVTHAEPNQCRLCPAQTFELNNTCVACPRAILLPEGGHSSCPPTINDSCCASSPEDRGCPAWNVSEVMTATWLQYSYDEPTDPIVASVSCSNGTLFLATLSLRILISDLAQDPPQTFTSKYSYSLASLLTRIDSMLLVHSENILLVLDSARRVLLQFASLGSQLIASCSIEVSRVHPDASIMLWSPPHHSPSLFLLESNHNSSIFRLDATCLSGKKITDLHIIQALTEWKDPSLLSHSIASVLQFTSNASHVELLLQPPNAEVHLFDAWVQIYVGEWNMRVEKVGHLPRAGGPWILRDLSSTYAFIMPSRDNNIVFWGADGLQEAKTHNHSRHIAGNGARVASVDGASSNETSFLPLSSSFIVQYYSKHRGYKFIILVDGYNLRVVLIKRLCECAENHFYHSSLDFCAPCSPAAPNSMQGSRGSCTSCPIGSYLDWTSPLFMGQCRPCPPLFWIPSEDALMSSSLHAKYGPCRFADSSLAVMPSYVTFQQAKMFSNLKTNSGPFNLWLHNPLWISLFSNQPFALGDTFGPQWTVQYFADRRSPDAHFRFPGIWALCSEVRSKPYEPCHCKFGSFLRLRNEMLSIKDEPFHAQKPIIYAMRQELHENVLIPLYSSPLDNATEIKIDASSVIWDTGYCYAGWPAQYACADLGHFWDPLFYDRKAGACVPCPQDTQRLSFDSNDCVNISGSQASILLPGGVRVYGWCESGHYWNAQAKRCSPCPQHTFAPRPSANTECAPKKVMACPVDHFIRDAGGSADNTCSQCIPCSGDTFMQPPETCTGHTFYPPYACFPWFKSVEGKSTQVSIFRTTPSISVVSCAPFPPKNSVWGAGPISSLCYFRCKYGINMAKLTEYEFYLKMLMRSIYSASDSMSAVTSSLNLASNAVANLFPYPNPYSMTWLKQSAVVQSLLEEAVSSVCSPCDMSPCTVPFTWRPLWPDGCGPPCLLFPELCSSANSSENGCIAICAVPHNAFITGATNTRQLQTSDAACTWQCRLGWFRSMDACWPCNASSCSEGELFMGLSQCLPTTPKSQICVPCSSFQFEGAESVSAPLTRGSCKYNCARGYTENKNPQTALSKPCLSCASVTANIRCQHGYRVAACSPNCEMCSQKLPFSFFLNTKPMPSNDTTCRVVCSKDHHTISRWDYSVLPDLSLERQDGSYDVKDVLCEDCMLRPYADCTSSTSTYCKPGFYLSAENGTCVQCLNSFHMGCAPGTYAPACPGGNIKSQGMCMTCSDSDIPRLALDNVPGKWPTRIFLPYTRETQNETCPTACVRDSVFVNGSCVSCSLLHPESNFIFRAMWNASRGVRWWEPQWDPPYLGPRTLDANRKLLSENRIGVCWPCPLSFSSSVSQEFKGDDVCIFEQPLESSDATFKSQELIPFSDSNSFFIKSSSSVVFWLDPDFAGAPRRRLLEYKHLISLRERQSHKIWLHREASPCTSPERGLYWNSSLKICVQCPAHHYCPNTHTIKHCPPFSTSAIQSFSLDHCHCTQGFAPTSTEDGSLEGCVWKTSADHQQQRGRCPPGYSSRSSMLLFLALRFYPNHETRPWIECAQCEAGSWEYQGLCLPCPLGSSSAAASTQCTCSSMEIIRELGQTCPGNVQHEACEPGYYLHNAECAACPKGYYSRFRGNAPCMKCPESFPFTATAASTSVRDCVAHQD